MASKEQVLPDDFYDYGVDDRACYVDKNGCPVFGTVVEALENQLTIELDNGELIVVTEDGDEGANDDNPYGSALHQWYKSLDLSLIQTGTVLSKAVPISLYESERHYANVFGIITGERVVLQMHDDPDFLKTLKADPERGITLEAALFRWEVEG